jgi:hypothetical protein
MTIEKTQACTIHRPETATLRYLVILFQCLVRTSYFLKNALPDGTGFGIVMPCPQIRFQRHTMKLCNLRANERQTRIIKTRENREKEKRTISLLAWPQRIEKTLKKQILTPVDKHVCNRDAFSCVFWGFPWTR